MKRFLLIPIVLVFLSGCSRPGFDEGVKKADMLLGAGKTTAALHVYESIVKAHENDPRSAAVLIQIARIYSDMKHDDDKALQVYNKVIGEYPITPAGRIALEQHARIMDDRGDYDSAAGDMTSLIKYFPEKADLYRVILAGMYIAAKEYPEARSELSPILDQEGGAEEKIVEAAAFTYAESYFIEGRNSEAKKWLKMFIREFPDSRLSAEAKLHLATTFEEMGRLGAARRIIFSDKGYPNEEVIDRSLTSIGRRGIGAAQAPPPVHMPAKMRGD